MFFVVGPVAGKRVPAGLWVVLCAFMAAPCSARLSPRPSFYRFRRVGLRIACGWGKAALPSGAA